MGVIAARSDAGYESTMLLQLGECEFVHRFADAKPLQRRIDGIQADLACLAFRVDQQEDEAGHVALYRGDVHF